MMNLITLITLLVSLSVSGCHKEEHRYIYVKNKSDKPMYYGLSYSFPDTSLQKIGNVPGDSGNKSHKILSGEQKTMMAAALTVNSTIQLFIFDADVIEKNPWDSIVAHRMVLKRYQFTESDMEKMNWTITYP